MRRTQGTLVSVSSLVLLLACGNGSDGKVVRTAAASRAASFSAWSDPVPLNINTAASEQQATLSKDGLTLYFASNRSGGPLDIWVAHRADLGATTPWREPVNLGTSINTPLSDFAPALSHDGHWLFFGSARAGFGSADIWASWRQNVHDDFGWQEPVNLGPGINTLGFEGGPAYFENDELGVAQLYYNHNDNRDNFGGHIFVSTRAADGSWGLGTPVAELNSDASDQRPSVSYNGLEIYFASNRPANIDTDIWFSTRANVLDPWSPPVNVGPPINTGPGALQPCESHPFIFSHGQIEELYFARSAICGLGTSPITDLYVSRRVRISQKDAP